VTDIRPPFGTPESNVGDSSADGKRQPARRGVTARARGEYGSVSAGGVLALFPEAIRGTDLA